MQVKIKETGKIESLVVVNQKTAVDYSADFIGNTGATNDGQFEWLEEDEIYTCDQDTFDWWTDHINKTELAESRKQEIIEEHGSDAVNEFLMGYDFSEFNDVPDILNGALDDFGQASK